MPELHPGGDRLRRRKRWTTGICVAVIITPVIVLGTLVFRSFMEYKAATEDTGPVIPTVGTIEHEPQQSYGVKIVDTPAADGTDPAETSSEDEPKVLSAAEQSNLNIVLDDLMEKTRGDN